MPLPTEYDHGTTHREGVAGPRPGEYWELREPLTRGFKDELVMPAGTACLVTDLKLVDDDELHAVELAVPPPFCVNTRYRSLTLTLDDFWEHFKVTDQAAVRQDRQAALAGYVEDMQRTQEQLAADVAELQRLPDLSGDEDTSQQLVSMRDQHGDLAQRTTALIETAEASTQRSQALVEATSGEISAQIKASMYGPRRIMSKLEKALQRLSAYGGEEVTVEQLLDGPPAAEVGPITVYQERRYMDEEYLVHLAEGGADVDDWSDFGKHLFEHPETLDRIIPAQIGMCVMRYRRSPRVYVQGSTAEAIEENASRNEANFHSLLLYRDGQSVWAIRSPVTEHSIPRLFPTKDDLDKPFRDFDGERIMREDLAYHRSFSKYEQQRFVYRLLVLVLWGIQDRERLFRSVPADKPLLQCVGDPAVFHWFHDAENLLPDGRAGVMDYLRKNQHSALVSGMRVLCCWATLVTEDTAPRLSKAAHWWVEDGSGEDPAFSVCIVRRSGDEYYVEVPVGYRSYSGDEDLEFTARVSLSRWRGSGSTKHGGLGYVLLDAVRLDDVEYYMTSRTARRHYMDYFHTFTALRRALREDRREQEDMRLAVQGEFHGVDLVFADAFHDAVRTWRAARRGAQLPRHGAETFDRVRGELATAIRQQLAHSAAGDAAPPVLAQLCDDAGPVTDRAFALTRSGRDRLITYGPALQHGASPIGLPPYVERRQWRASGKHADKWKFERLSWDAYTDPPRATETLLWAAPDATPTPCGSPLEELLPQQWQRLEQLLTEPCGIDLLAGQLPQEDVAAAAARVVKKMAEGEANAASILIPVASRWGQRIPQIDPDARQGDMEIWTVSVPFLWLAVKRLLSAEGIAQAQDALGYHARYLQLYSGYERQPQEVRMYRHGVRQLLNTTCVTGHPYLWAHFGTWGWLSPQRIEFTAKTIPDALPLDGYDAQLAEERSRRNVVFVNAEYASEWDDRYTRTAGWDALAPLLRDLLQAPARRR